MRLHARLRRDDRARRRALHREGRGRVDVRGLRRRPGRPRRGRRLRARRSRADHRASTSASERLAQAREHGATDTLPGGEGAVEQILEMTGGFGADYTFEATGNVAVMRQAVEAARMGWGLCIVAGVAGKGETLDVVPRFLITGRRVAGASFGGAQGPRQRARSSSQLYLEGQARRSTAFVSHHLPLERGQRGVRPDAPPGRDPHRPRPSSASQLVRLAACLCPRSLASRRTRRSLRPWQRRRSSAPGLWWTAARARAAMGERFPVV